jgi:hypothetical protein
MSKAGVQNQTSLSGSENKSAQVSNIEHETRKLEWQIGLITDTW